MAEDGAKDEQHPIAYRREALEERDALEQYDKSITIVRPRGWVVLAAIIVIVVAGLLWSILGRVSVTVQGQGILLRGGQIAQVVSVSSGKVATLLVGVGDDVHEGQKVALVDQPELRAQVRDLELQVEQARRDLDAVLHAAQPDQTAVAEAGQALRTAQAQLSSARTSYTTQSEVLSSWDGTVLSLQALPGQYVTPGAPVLTVEPPADQPLYATLYFPAGDGKKIAHGMQAQIVPATLQVEEYGYLLGEVVQVADVPSTPQDMQAVLQNETLVEQFSAEGPTILVTAEPTTDPATPSGYAWSSSEGPSAPPSSGTECTALVVISRQAPITYLFPALGRFYDGGD